MSARDEALLRTPHSHKEAMEQFALILYTASEVGPGKVLEVVDSFLRGCASGMAGRTASTWPLVLGRLATTRPSLSATLAGSRVSREVGTVVTVLVPKLVLFKKAQLERAANKQLVEDAIHDVCGRRLAVRFADAAGKQAEVEADDRISRVGPLIAWNLVRSPRAIRGVLAGLANEIVLVEAGGDLAARPDMILVQTHLRLLRELAGQVAA